MRVDWVRRSVMGAHLVFCRWLALGAALGALVACAPEATRIQIKGPRDAVESVKAKPTFPPFEKKNDTLQLRASAYDAKDRFLGSAEVDWESSDRSVVTVSQGGLLTVLSSGEVTIKATSTKTKATLTDSLTVKAIIVDDIRIRKPVVEAGKSLELALGDIVQIEAEVLDDKGNVIPDAKIRWESTSYAATVTPTGEMEGRAIGQTQVIAEAKNGATAKLEVTVKDWKKAGRKKR